MGWYDAFKGDTKRVNMNAMTSDSGSAAKNFGDAFKDTANFMLKVNDEKRKDRQANKRSEFMDTQMENMVQTNTIKANEQEQKAEDWVQTEDNKDYLSRAYESSTPSELKKNYPLDDTNAVDAPTLQKAQTHFQTKFNDEAVEASVVKDYKDMNTFVDDNNVLVENADGATLKQIDKYFNDEKRKDRQANKRSEFMDTQMENMVQTNTIKANEQEQKAEDWVQAEDNKDYLASAMGATSLAELKKNHPLDDTNAVDAPTLQKAQTHFQTKRDKEFKGAVASIQTPENLQLFKDNYEAGNGFGNVSSSEIDGLNAKVASANTVAQDNYNQEAKGKALTGGYKNINSFLTDPNNASLVQRMSGKAKVELANEFGKKALNNSKIRESKAKTSKAEKTTFNDDLLKLKKSINLEYGKYDKATGHFAMDESKKEIVEFELAYGTELLNNGIKSLSQISKLTKDAYAKKLEAEEQEVKKPSFRDLDIS